MAITSNKIDVSDLVTAIQQYAAACVREAKLPRYAESRRIDAIKGTRYAHMNYMLEIDRLTDYLSMLKLQTVPNHNFYQDPSLPCIVGHCDYTYNNGDRCGLKPEEHARIMDAQ
jgi:hypothetical protein